MALRQLDNGGKLLLEIALGGDVRPALSIELFTDAQGLSDSEQTRELATGGGYVEKDLDAVAWATSLSDGIPIIEWEDVVWTFSGALTNAVNKTIKGYMVLLGATVVFEELLSDPMTPTNPGDILKVAPVYKLGNVADAASI
jgi:hypothetical protein